jgi:hypothetical protein
MTRSILGRIRPPKDNVLEVVICFRCAVMEMAPAIHQVDGPEIIRCAVLPSLCPKGSQRAHLYRFWKQLNGHCGVVRPSKKACGGRGPDFQLHRPTRLQLVLRHRTLFTLVPPRGGLSVSQALPGVWVATHLIHVRHRSISQP